MIINQGNQAQDDAWRAAVGITAIRVMELGIPAPVLQKCASCVYYATHFDQWGWGYCPWRETLISRNAVACREHQASI